MTKKSTLVLTFLSCIALTGCGGSSTDDNLTDSIDVPSITDDGDITRDDQGNIIYNNIELDMWAVTTGDDAETQDAIIKKFNEAYKGMISVTTRHVSRYDLETQLQSVMEFDKENAPDLLFNHGSWAAEYYSRKWLQPIKPYIDLAEIVLDEEDYVKSLLDSTTIGGALFGLPQDVHSSMVVVRKDILDKNNLAIPTNYTELVALSEQVVSLAASGNLEIRGSNSDGYPATEWRKASTNSQYQLFPISYGDMWVHEFAGYTAAAQNGGSFVDNNGLPGWNTPEVAKGIEVVRNWLFPTSSSANKHSLSTYYGSDYDVGLAPFAKGEAIFKLNGPWAYQTDLNNFDRDLKDDGGSANITTIPMSNLFAKDSSKDYASKIKGEGHAFMLLNTVESNTKACAAMIFSDWMVNNAGIEWAKRGHLPSLKSVEKSTEYLEDPAYESYLKNWGSCEDYIVIPPTKNYSYIDSYFKSALQLSMSKDAQGRSVESILQEKYEDCVDYIELYA